MYIGYKELIVSGMYCSPPPGQTYIACEWQSDVKDKCYDLNVAQVRIYLLLQLNECSVIKSDVCTDAYAPPHTHTIPLTAGV